VENEIAFLDCVAGNPGRSGWTRHDTKVKLEVVGGGSGGVGPEKRW